MPNLTLEKKLIKQAPDLNPVVGHVLVVFERVGKGQRFLTVVEEGHQFSDRKSWWQWMMPNRSNYVAYAVNMDPNLSFGFSRKVNHTDQLHAFDLSFKVKFRIADPQSFATCFLRHTEADPLTRLQNSIAEAVSQRTARASFNDVRHNFETVVEKLIAKAQVEYNELAKSLGFDLKTVEVSCFLDEKELELQKLEEQARREMAQRDHEHKMAMYKKNLAQKNLEADRNFEARQAREKLAESSQLTQLEQELHQAEVHRRMQDSITKAADVALQLAARSVNSPSELRHLANEFIQIVSELRLLGAGNGSSAPQSSPHLLTATSGTPASPLAVFQQAFQLINGIRCRPEEKRQLVAIAAHLLAELLRGEAADPVTVQTYHERLTDLIISKLSDLTREQFEALERFFSLSHLKEQIG